MAFMLPLLADTAASYIGTEIFTDWMSSGGKYNKKHSKHRGRRHDRKHHHHKKHHSSSRSRSRSASTNKRLSKEEERVENEVMQDLQGTGGELDPTAANPDIYAPVSSMMADPGAMYQAASKHERQKEYQTTLPRINELQIVRPDDSTTIQFLETFNPAISATVRFEESSREPRCPEDWYRMYTPAIDIRHRALGERWEHQGESANTGRSARNGSNSYHFFSMGIYPTVLLDGASRVSTVRPYAVCYSNVEPRADSMLHYPEWDNFVGSWPGAGTIKLDVSLLGDADCKKSLVSAINLCAPLSETYIWIMPMDEVSSKEGYDIIAYMGQLASKLLPAEYDIDQADDRTKLSFGRYFQIGGASLGLAAIACFLNFGRAAYTGFVRRLVPDFREKGDTYGYQHATGYDPLKSSSNLLQHGTTPGWDALRGSSNANVYDKKGVRQKIYGASELIRVARGSTMVETVDMLQYKVSWALMTGYPLVIPYSSDMNEPLETVLKSEKFRGNHFALSLSPNAYSIAQADGGLNYHDTRTPILIAATVEEADVLADVAMTVYKSKDRPKPLAITKEGLKLMRGDEHAQMKIKPDSARSTRNGKPTRDYDMVQRMMKRSSMRPNSSAISEQRKKGATPLDDVPFSVRYAHKARYAATPSRSRSRSNSQVARSRAPSEEVADIIRSRTRSPSVRSSDRQSYNGPARRTRGQTGKTKPRSTHQRNYAGGIFSKYVLPIGAAVGAGLLAHKGYEHAQFLKNESGEDWLARHNRDKKAAKLARSNSGGPIHGSRARDERDHGSSYSAGKYTSSKKGVTKKKPLNATWKKKKALKSNVGSLISELVDETPHTSQNTSMAPSTMVEEDEPSIIASTEMDLYNKHRSVSQSAIRDDDGMVDTEDEGTSRGDSAPTVAPIEAMTEKEMIEELPLPKLGSEVRSTTPKKKKGFFRKYLLPLGAAVGVGALAHQGVKKYKETSALSLPNKQYDDLPSGMTLGAQQQKANRKKHMNDIEHATQLAFEEHNQPHSGATEPEVTEADLYVPHYERYKVPVTQSMRRFTFDNPLDEGEQDLSRPYTMSSAARFAASQSFPQQGPSMASHAVKAVGGMILAAMLAVGSDKVAQTARKVLNIKTEQEKLATAMNHLANETRRQNDHKDHDKQQRKLMEKMNHLEIEKHLLADKLDKNPEAQEIAAHVVEQHHNHQQTQSAGKWYSKKKPNSKKKKAPSKRPRPSTNSDIDITDDEGLQRLQSLAGPGGEEPESTVGNPLDALDEGVTNITTEGATDAQFLPEGSQSALQIHEPPKESWKNWAKRNLKKAVIGAVVGGAVIGGSYLTYRAIQKLYNPVRAREMINSFMTTLGKYEDNIRKAFPTTWMALIPVFAFWRASEENFAAQKRAQAQQGPEQQIARDEEIGQRTEYDIPQAQQDVYQQLQELQQRWEAGFAYNQQMKVKIAELESKETRLMAEINLSSFGKQTNYERQEQKYQDSLDTIKNLQNQIEEARTAIAIGRASDTELVEESNKLTGQLDEIKERFKELQQQAGIDTQEAAEEISRLQQNIAGMHKTEQVAKRELRGYVAKIKELEDAKNEQQRQFKETSAAKYKQFQEDLNAKREQLEISNMKFLNMQQLHATTRESAQEEINRITDMYDKQKAIIDKFQQAADYNLIELQKANQCAASAEQMSQITAAKLTALDQANSQLNAQMTAGWAENLALKDTIKTKTDAEARTNSEYQTQVRALQHQMQVNQALAQSNMQAIEQKYQEQMHQILIDKKDYMNQAEATMRLHEKAMAMLADWITIMNNALIQHSKNLIGSNSLATHGFLQLLNALQVSSDFVQTGSVRTMEQLVAETAKLSKIAMALSTQMYVNVEMEHELAGLINDGYIQHTDDIERHMQRSLRDVPQRVIQNIMQQKHAVMQLTNFAEDQDVKQILYQATIRPQLQLEDVKPGSALALVEYKGLTRSANSAGRFGRGRARIQKRRGRSTSSMRSAGSWKDHVNKIGKLGLLQTGLTTAAALGGAGLAAHHIFNKNKASSTHHEPVQQHSYKEPTLHQRIAMIDRDYASLLRARSSGKFCAPQRKAKAGAFWSDFKQGLAVGLNPLRWGEIPDAAHGKFRSPFPPGYVEPDTTNGMVEDIEDLNADESAYEQAHAGREEPSYWQYFQNIDDDYRRGNPTHQHRPDYWEKLQHENLYRQSMGMHPVVIKHEGFETEDPRAEKRNVAAYLATHPNDLAPAAVKPGAKAGAKFGGSRSLASLYSNSSSKKKGRGRNQAKRRKAGADGPFGFLPDFLGDTGKNVVGGIGSAAALLGTAYLGSKSPGLRNLARSVSSKASNVAKRAGSAVSSVGKKAANIGRRVGTAVRSANLGQKATALGRKVAHVGSRAAHYGGKAAEIAKLAYEYHEPIMNVAQMVMKQKAEEAAENAQRLAEEAKVRVDQALDYAVEKADDFYDSIAEPSASDAVNPSAGARGRFGKRRRMGASGGWNNAPLFAMGPAGAYGAMKNLAGMNTIGPLRQAGSAGPFGGGDEFYTAMGPEGFSAIDQAHVSANPSAFHGLKNAVGGAIVSYGPGLARKVWDMGSSVVSGTGKHLAIPLATGLAAGMVPIILRNKRLKAAQEGLADNLIGSVLDDDDDDEEEIEDKRTSRIGLIGPGGVYRGPPLRSAGKFKKKEKRSRSKSSGRSRSRSGSNSSRPIADKYKKKILDNMTFSKRYARQIEDNTPIAKKYMDEISDNMPIAKRYRVHSKGQRSSYRPSAAEELDNMAFSKRYAKEIEDNEPIAKKYIKRHHKSTILKEPPRDGKRRPADKGEVEFKRSRHHHKRGSGGRRPIRPGTPMPKHRH